MARGEKAVTANWVDYIHFVEEAMEREHIAGAAVAVAQHGSVLFQSGFGYRDVEQELPVTPETIFGIASVSKSFTAMAIMQLADEGLLSVDDPVTKFLPEFRLKGVKNMADIKIKHLLSHTTGLPPMRRRQDIRTFEKHMEFLADEEYELLGQPGQYLSYCNDTFLLLGAIIERVSGLIYRKYMATRLLNPLAMYRTTFSIEELERFQNVTVPYMYDKNAGEFQAQAWPALGNFEVGGGVRSCVSDLLHYGQVYINSGCRGQESLVSPRGLAEMRKPIYRYGRKTWYGSALSITPDHAGITLVEHGGSQPGVAANFGFVPEHGLVVAVLTNTSGVSANLLWLGAVNKALGLPLDLPRSEEPAYAAKAEEEERILGNYRTAEGGNLDVFTEAGRLFVKVDGEVYAARMSGPQTAVYIHNVPKPLKFYFKGQEPAWAVFSGLRMLRRAD